MLNKADEFLLKQEITPKELQVYRIQLDKTQEELADILGVVTKTWGRWERGEEKPAHPGMLRLALEHLLVLRSMTRTRKRIRSFNEINDEIERYKRLIEEGDQRRVKKKKALAEAV